MTRRRTPQEIADARAERDQFEANDWFARLASDAMCIAEDCVSKLRSYPSDEKELVIGGREVVRVRVCWVAVAGRNLMANVTTGTLFTEAGVCLTSDQLVLR